MGLAPLGYEVWTQHLRHNPLDPHWPDRDRFVLSLGHASMLIYSLLHLTGYELSLDDIKDFRQWGAKTPGHPEFRHTPGVETTTGPLGQGVANSVGMALAERWMADRFNRPGHTVVDHFTYVFCSDGDLMEGISHEAGEIAGHQKLGKLIWIYDDNQISIEGGTDLTSCTDQEKRFQGYGWHVLRVEDGNDRAARAAALQSARDNTEEPSLIILRTQIAFGSPGKAGSESSHGAPLGEEEIKATKENLGYPSLEVNGEVIARMVEGGADIIELQIPFSEPVADGPVIARACQEAIAGGVTVRQCLDFAADVAARHDIPFLLMTYCNILFKYGMEAFIERARAIGIEGFIVPDLPPEESGDYLPLARRHGIAPIEIFAPTSTDERMRALAESAEGFIYCVARRGVTGAHTDFGSAFDDYLARCRAATDLPLAVGFGIRSRGDVEYLTGKADIAVVGSETIRILDEKGVEAVGPFVKSLR